MYLLSWCENTSDLREFLIDDIILGPPRTAFSSASRIYGKPSTDATERPSKYFDSDETRGDRYNFRDKFFKDREAGDKDFDRRDGRPGLLNNRRGDREDWNSGRPRRTFPQDDLERKPRRNGEGWESRDGFRDRDSRDFNNGYERGPRDRDGRFALRKDGPGRGRFDGSWFRDGNSHEGPDAEEERFSIRNKDWRRDRHGTDREWHRGSKIEHEPEWLDSSDKGDHRRVHTQEDFERWKERMKANSGQSRSAEKEEGPTQQVSEAPQAPPAPKPEIRPTDGSLFSEQSTPFQTDVTMEKFFGLLKDPKPTQEASTPVAAEVTTTVKKETVPAKPAKSSRFAGLFSPQTETSPAQASASPASEHKEHKPSVDQSGGTKDADQEGFQRILQMLGGGAGAAKSRTVTPKVDSLQSRPPSQVQAEGLRVPVQSSSPAIEPKFTDQQQNSPVRGQDSPLGQNNVKESQIREREHLLRLMQQVQIAPPPNNDQRQPPPNSRSAAAGLPNMPEVLSRPQGISAPHKSANFFDDPAIANMRRPDGRQLPNGLPVGFLDDIPFSHGNQIPITPGGTRVPQGLNPPPISMQQLPGFEHAPRPLWAGGQLPPQQGGGPSPLAPPPGIPTPARGINPGFPSNMMPMQAPMNERQPFLRGAGGPPPGIMPPPGYMNVNGPLPSGFPPMPHGSDPMLGHDPYGSVNPGPHELPPSSRHLLDMLGHTGGIDSRGGLVGPGNFR